MVPSPTPDERTYSVSWRDPNGKVTTCKNLSPRVAFARLWAAQKAMGEITVLEVVPEWTANKGHKTDTWDYPLPPPKCEDDTEGTGWTCVMYDGTGLWCPACASWSEAYAAVLVDKPEI